MVAQARVDDVVVRWPVVIATSATEAEAVLARARAAGVVEVARHGTGADRVVIECDLIGGAAHGAPAETTGLLERFGRGERPGSPPDAAAAVADIVRRLRTDGVAAVAGPPSPGFAPVWARHSAPVYFADDACICQPWSVFDRAAVRTVVEIDPGAGFGSGGHPTTLLLLRRLATMELRGRRVLDVGCGTGVLAVAAALLGAEQVMATDIADAAVVASRRNVETNGVADRVTVNDAPVESIDGRFDLVLANIHAPVLTTMAGDLRRLTAGGLLAVSGLSPAQTSALVAALAPMVPAWTEEVAEWCAMGLRIPRRAQG